MKYNNSVVTLVDSTGSIHIHDKSSISSIKSSNKYINFKSTSYLSLNKELKVKLAAEKAIKEYGLGSYGYITPYHIELNQSLEKIYGSSHRIQTYQNDVRDILLYNLICSEDYVFIDEHINNSFKQILNSSVIKNDHIIIYSHNDVSDLAEKLESIILDDPDSKKFIITEGVFELQGDICSLPELLNLSKKYGCITILDESNALGVIGKKGLGSFDYHQCQQEVDIIFCSMDKVLCSSGQFYIFNNKIESILSHQQNDLFDESFYSPISTLSAAVANSSLDIILNDTTKFKNINNINDDIKNDENVDDSSIHSQLIKNIKYWKKKCQTIGLKFIESSSAITSIIIENEDIEALAQHLFKNKIKCYYVKKAFNMNYDILKFNILRSMNIRLLDEAFTILQSILINYYPKLVHLTTIPKEIQIENMADPTQEKVSPLKEHITDSDPNVHYPKAYPKFAIIGTGIRLPGEICNKDDFWKIMTEKKVITGLIPEDRWDRDEWYSKVEKPGTIQTIHGGFIENAFDFDNKFFGISQNEALDATPEQRWLCELTVETIEDANIDVDDFKGSNTGVFVGTSGMDYGSYVYSVPEKITKYTYSGIEPSIHANRVSYLFDLHGPSLSTNTACSSSMTALSIACNSLAVGDCEMAIVAGTNFFQTPSNGVAYSQLRVVSKKGACRPFDAAADGYARLEGAAMVLLKPYEKALRDNNKIYATILSTACNEDGKTASLTTPSSKAQSQLMKRVYDKGHIDPCTIDFVEAHGTGTAVGDPIEARSIGEAYGKVNKNNGNPPIPVGSVKGNVGHGEYLSGVVGLIKGALILHKQTIVPQTAFDILNPGIDCDKLGIRIADKMEPLSGKGRHRVAINSFGFGGANANVILEEEPQFDKNNISVLIKRNKLGERIPCPYVGFFSASNLRLLKETLNQWLNIPEKELLPMLYLNSTTRRVLSHRFFIFVKNSEEFYQTIRSFINENENTIENGYKANEHMMYIETTSDRKKGLTMAFDEPLTFSTASSFLRNSTYNDLCIDLYNNNVYFANCIDYCDKVYQVLSNNQCSLLQDYDLFKLDKEKDPEKKKNFRHDLIKDPSVIIMLNGVIQLSLSALLKYYGVNPTSVIGYGSGEIAAAYAAEKISLKDAIKILYHYGRVLSSNYNKQNQKQYSIMLGSSVGKVNQFILSKLTEKEKEGISISGIQSPVSCSISGEYEILNKIVTMAKDVEIKTLGTYNDIFGIHSKMINESIKKELMESLKDIKTHDSDISMFSTVKFNKEGKPYTGVLDGQYWWMNMRCPVLYAQVLSHTINSLPTDGKNILEIGLGFDHPVIKQASQAFCEKKRIYNIFTYEEKYDHKHYSSTNQANYNISFKRLIHFISLLHGDNVTPKLNFGHLWETYVDVKGGDNSFKQLYSIHYDLPTRCWNHKYLRKLFKAMRNGLPGDVNVGIKTKDVGYLEKLAQMKKGEKTLSKSVSVPILRKNKEEKIQKDEKTMKKAATIILNQKQESTIKKTINPSSISSSSSNTIVNEKIFKPTSVQSTSDIYSNDPYKLRNENASGSNNPYKLRNENASGSIDHLDQKYESKTSSSNIKTNYIESKSNSQSYASEDDAFWIYENNKYLVDHQVNNKIVFPAAGSVSRALYGYMRSRGLIHDNNNNKVNNIVALNNLEFIGLTSFQNKAEDQLNSKGPIPMKLYEDTDHQFTLKHQDGSVISKGIYVDASSQKEITNFPNLSEIIKSCSTVNGGEGIHKDYIYQRTEAIQLHYGPEFQLIQSGRSGKKYSYAKIKITKDHEKMICHPAVLDNCFHSIICLGLGCGNRQILPYKIKRFEMANGGYFKSNFITCVSQLLYQDLNSVIIDLFIYDESGQPLVKIKTMEFLIRKLKQIRPLDWYNVLNYEKINPTIPQKSFPIPTSHVIVLCTKSQEAQVQLNIIPTLSNMNMKITLLNDSNTHNQNLQTMIMDQTINKSNVVLIDLCLLDDSSIETAFVKIQYYVSNGLNFIIGNIRLDHSKNDENLENLFTASQGIPGMLRAARSESRSSHMYSIQANKIEGFAYGLFSGCLSIEEPDIFVDDNKTILVNRLISKDSIPQIQSKNFDSESKRFGNINKIVFRKSYGIPDIYSTSSAIKNNRNGEESNNYNKDESDYVVVKVKMISLQNNDVLQNSFPDLVDSMKNSNVVECVGTIVQVGSKVKNFKRGDFIFGLNLQSNHVPSTYVKIHQDLLFHIDKNNILAQHNLISSVYAYTMALYLLNNIQANESVILSTMASDLMQALIVIAQQKNISVIIDDPTMKYSKSTNPIFMNLRQNMIVTKNESEYIRNVKELSKDGQGVNYIIDANIKLEKEKEVLLERCLRSVTPVDDEYIKVGNLSHSAKKVTTHKIVQMSKLTTQQILPFVRQAIDMISNYSVNIIDLKTYPLSKISNASIEILSGRLQGKSCLSMVKEKEKEEEEEEEIQNCLPSRIFKEDKSYLVTGAFGGVGLRVSLWMQLRGARHIILTTSSNPENKYNHPIVNALRQKGVHVTITKCNICNYNEVEKLFKETTPVIDGVFHFANKFGPKLIRDSSFSNFISSFEPKARGALNLHKISQSGFPLSTFVLFSSVLDLFGNPGQIAYGAANSFLNNLTYYRRKKGLSSQCFSLPAMKGSGYLSQWKQGNQSREFSEVIELLDSEDLSDILDFFLREDVDPCIQLISRFQINNEYSKHIAPVTNVLMYKLNKGKITIPLLIKPEFPPLKHHKILEDKENYILHRYVYGDYSSLSSNHRSYSPINSGESTAGDSSVGDSSVGDSNNGESSTGDSSIGESIDSEKTLKYGGSINGKKNNNNKNNNNDINMDHKIKKSINDNKHVFYKHLENGIYNLTMKNHYMTLEYAEELGQAISNLSQLQQMKVLIIEYEENFSKGLEPSLKEQLSKEKPSKSKLKEVYKIYFNCLKISNINVPIICCLNGEITDLAILIALLSNWKIITRRSFFYSKNNPININWMKELVKAKDDTKYISLIKQLETENISAIDSYKAKYINDIVSNIDNMRKAALAQAKKIIKYLSSDDNNSNNILDNFLTTEDIEKLNNAIRI